MKVVTCAWDHRASYKIPKGIDLKNKEQVQDWFIKYNELVIILTNGKRIEIQQYRGYERILWLKIWPVDETIKIEDADSEYSDSDSEPTDSCKLCGDPC